MPTPATSPISATAPVPQRKSSTAISNLTDKKPVSARPSPFYRPELDAIRFVLFLLVLFAHYKEYVPISTVAHPWLFASQVAVGFALPVFFLLSAFLIVELLLRERAKTGTIAVRQFYIRRILRIWPLYFGVFYGLAVVAHWLPKVGPPNHTSWLAFTLFAGNLYILKHGWVTYTIAPLWSISVEEQFYLTIPWLARWRGARAIAWISGLLVLVSYLSIWRYFLHLTAADNMIWVSSLVQFQFFAVGALLAIAMRGWTPQYSLGIRAALFAGAAACWFTAESALHWTVSYWHPLSLGRALGGWGLGLAGVVLIFLATLGFPQRFVPNWLVKLGNLSFGLYLFHSIALYLCFFTLGKVSHRIFGAAAIPVMTIVALALMWAMASLSYRFIEMPCLKLKRHFTVVASKDEVAVVRGATGDRALTHPDPTVAADAALAL